MFRTVPHIRAGLRAVALAAILGGQSACVRSVPVAAASRATNVNVRTASVESADSRSEAARVVVRDYWRAFKSDVVGWADNEQWQGLRGAVLRDGVIAYDHVLFYSAYAVPNLDAFKKPEWFAFSNADNKGKELIFNGMRADIFNCQGTKGCSPYVYFSARVPDAVLRSSQDSLVVRVVAYGGYETTISLRGDLIRSYLAVVDSVSANRKMKSAASNHQ